jgi:hypothetical protein
LDLFPWYHVVVAESTEVVNDVRYANYSDTDQTSDPEVTVCSGEHIDYIRDDEQHHCKIELAALPVTLHLAQITGAEVERVFIDYTSTSLGPEARHTENKSVEDLKTSSTAE